MKSTLIVAAIATLASSAAMAQGSVTIYGRANVTVESQKIGEDSITKMENNASRLGIKGVEDLGGGLKAGFLLEHGFNIDTGTASGAFWGRESNVYIEGAFGKVRLGNMGSTAAYFATADYISMHNHDTGTSSDAFYLYPGDPRNTIAYTLPTFAGLSVEVQLGLKETQAAGAKNTVVVAANYDRGPLHLGFGYVGGNATLDGVSLVDTKEYGFRGLYEMGPLTLGAYFAMNDGKTAGQVTPAVPADLKVERTTYRFSAMYAMGASEFHANVGKAGKIKVDGDDQADTDATQFTLGYNYNLSKRTKLYGYYTKVDNSADVGYLSGTAGADFSSFAVGVRHNF